MNSVLVLRFQVTAEASYWIAAFGVWRGNE
jgi:hypothetical protein